MTDMIMQDPFYNAPRVPRSMHWRVARGTVVTALGWILTLPVLAQLMRWPRETAAWVQTILGSVSGLVWGRIGWVGVKRHGFSTEDAFLAGGLAGAVAPTIELTLRRLGWPPGSKGYAGTGHPAEIGAERPPLSAYPWAWLWGFLVGGLVAALGAIVARMGRD